jgi:hypothetical protein
MLTQKNVTSMFFLVNQNHDAVSIQFRSTKVFFSKYFYIKMFTELASFVNTNISISTKIWKTFQRKKMTEI